MVNTINKIRKLRDRYPLHNERLRTTKGMPIARGTKNKAIIGSGGYHGDAKYRMGTCLRFAQNTRNPLITLKLAEDTPCLAHESSPGPQTRSLRGAACCSWRGETKREGGEDNPRRINHEFRNIRIVSLQYIPELLPAVILTKFGGLQGHAY